jgi:glycosyltransferase involved in cell wall biosynthesis
MSAPRVSVIIATYNYGHFLGEAVSSVLGQTVTSWELIVVDDGSTDNTGEVVQQFADPRIRYLPIEHGGLSIARNTGIDASTGEYLAFLDADDRFRPTMLERHLALMESEPEVSLCFSDLIRFTDQRVLEYSQFDLVPELRRMATRPSRAGHGCVLLGDPFETLTAPRQSPVWVPTCLIRRAHLADMRFPPEVRLCQDLVFVLTVLSRFSCVAFIEEPFLEVRRHGANANERDRAIPAALDALLRVAQLPLSARHRRALRRMLGYVWASTGRDAWQRGRFWDMTAAYGKALTYPGSRWSAVKHLAAAPLWPLFRMGQVHNRTHN